MRIKLHDRIMLRNNLHGFVRYIGEVKGRPGNWVGLELDEARGSNNGTVGDERYFHCQEKHGIFVKYDKLTEALKNIEDETHDIQKETHSSLWDTSPDIEKQPELKYTKMLFSARKVKDDNVNQSRGDEKKATEDEIKYKELFEEAVVRWKKSLLLIQKLLGELKQKVERIKSIKKPIEESNTVVKLVEDIITAEKHGDEKGFQSLYEKFKEEMKKYEINLD
ncbi:hypothetical protein GINT2_000518 [Glugoides intestinalis]